MRKDITEQHVKVQFDSLAEAYRFLDEQPIVWRDASTKGDRARMDWDLNAGYDGALEMARKGWPEGARIAKGVLASLPALAPAPRTVTDFYGYRPHVARFCAGAPDSMIRNDTRQGEGKVLALYVSIGVSSGTPAECIRNYGLAIARTVDDLEAQGNRVELYAAYSCSSAFGGSTRKRGAGVQGMYCVRVKRADQTLDLATLAFVIGHPAFFRRICFAIMERCEGHQFFAYGYPARLNVSETFDPVHGAIALNGMNDAKTNAKTIEQALELVQAEIDEAKGVI